MQAYELWQTLPRQKLQVGDTVRYHGNTATVTSWDKHQVWLVYNGKKLVMGPSAIGCQIEVVQLPPEKTMQQQSLPTSQAPATKKEYQRVGLELLQQLLTRTGWNLTQASTRLGYSDHAASGWIRDGNMPAVAALACKALLAEHGGPAKTASVPEPKLVLLCVWPDGTLDHQPLAGLDTITLNGKQYWLLQK